MADASEILSRCSFYTKNFNEGREPPKIKMAEKEEIRTSKIEYNWGNEAVGYECKVV